MLPHTDCTDGSDETVLECISFQCSDTKFRCAYGACVNLTAECDGVKDCADNSGKSADLHFQLECKVQLCIGRGY